MKDIRDYLHLYTGCKISTPYGECKFLYFKSDLDPREYNQIICDRGDNVFAFTADEVKLILRPLESMTKEEVDESNRVGSEGWKLINPPDSLKLYTHAGVVFRQAAEIKYLCSIGIDIFGLSSAGLAVYETDNV